MSQSASVADWSVLEEPGVEKVLGQVASKVGRDFYPTIEEDDAKQEAVIILATHADVARSKLAEGGERFLSRWLWEQVVLGCRTELARSARMTAAELDENGEVPCDEEFLKGFREDDGVDYPVEVRAL